MANSRSLGSVSYTHLDVYKRQVNLLVLSLPGGRQPDIHAFRQGRGGDVHFPQHDDAGLLLSLIHIYAVQSSVLDGSVLSAGGKAVTPDVAGVASDYIEMKYEEDETVGFFLLGAAGDQAPAEKAVNETFVQGQRIVKDRHEEGFLICERLGSQLGEAVCAIAEGIVCREILSEIEYGRVLFRVPGKAMERELKNLHPVKTMEYVLSLIHI